MTSLPIDILRDVLPNQPDIQYIRLYDANFNHVIVVKFNLCSFIIFHTSHHHTLTYVWLYTAMLM